MSRLAAVLLLLLALAACGGSGTAPATPGAPSGPAAAQAPKPADGVSRPPTEEERGVIASLSRLTERTRELTFEHPVPVLIQDQVRITAHLSAMIEEEDLDEARVVYSALGLVDPAVNLREMIERLASEQVVGYYDPRESQLVVREDIMIDRRPSSNGEAAAVLVHELVHALQDQRLGLGEVYQDDRDTDADNAFDGLVEGDATLAMLAYVLADQGAPLDLLTQKPELLGDLLAAAPLHGMELESAPPIVRVTLVAPYFKGLIFTASLHGRGGWDAVNRAHAHPPVSTEQLLHPAKYLAGEQPEAVELPELPELDHAGYEAFKDDTLGELELAVYLAQHRPGLDTDDAAAAGWAGDRIRVYRHPERKPAVVWFTLWDDQDEAREAAAAARAVVGALSRDRRPHHRVERAGRAVLIVRDLPPALHGPVQGAFRRLAGKV
jgi:hypothetical protein